MATTAGQKLSLGKLGRAVSSSRSNYTTKSSLGQNAGTTSTKTKMSEFSIDTVANSLDGYAYVDEQTSETYTLDFTGKGSLFQSKIGSVADNFSWTTNNSDAFSLSGGATTTGSFTAGAISATIPGDEGALTNATESSLVTDGDFNNWDNTRTLTNWYESSSGGNIITKKDISGFATQPSSGSNNFVVQFDTNNTAITQSFNVQGNSTYQIRTLASSSFPGSNDIDLYISCSTHTMVLEQLTASGSWHQTRDDFYTSGSEGTSFPVELKFSASLDGHTALLDAVFFERWAGGNMADQTVQISGKFVEDGQSDGFNDHATRYNTAITKDVEIQDTYGGQSIACFLPGTKIIMSNNEEKNIEDISVGDEVLSLVLPGLPDEDLGYSEWKSFTMRPLDDYDIKNLEASTATVETLFYDLMQGYWNVTHESGSIRVTSEHDFWSYRLSEDVGDGQFQRPQWEWNKPGELKVGYKLLDYKGDILTINSLEYISGEVEVINFDVEPLDIYFAGGVLVHNKGADSDPG